MSTEAERKHIREVLIPELLEDFGNWSLEYQQERDLGLRGEFANLYRKARKLKSVLWDGVDPTFWRESLRTIVKEVVGHGLLMLVDIDHGGYVRPKPESPVSSQKAIPPEAYEMRLEAARKAASGDPSELEEMGFMLVDRPGFSDQPGAKADICHLKNREGHSFSPTCAYMIRRRRDDTG